MIGASAPNAVAVMAAGVAGAVAAILAASAAAPSAAKAARKAGAAMVVAKAAAMKLFAAMPPGVKAEARPSPARMAVLKDSRARMAAARVAVNVAAKPVRNAARWMHAQTHRVQSQAGPIRLATIATKRVKAGSKAVTKVALKAVAMPSRARMAGASATAASVATGEIAPSVHHATPPSRSLH